MKFTKPTVQAVIATAAATAIITLSNNNGNVDAFQVSSSSRATLRSSSSLLNGAPTTASTTTTSSHDSIEEDEEENDIDQEVIPALSKKNDRLRMMKKDTFHRNGFKEVRVDVEDIMKNQFKGSIIDELKSNNNIMEKNGVKVYLAKVSKTMIKFCLSIYNQVCYVLNNLSISHIFCYFFIIIILFRLLYKLL